MTSPLPGSVFESLRRIDTCTASNAVERLSSRLRNEGFVSRAVTCRFPDAPPLHTTMPELSKFVTESWVGLFAPKGTPQEIVGFYNGQMQAFLAQADIPERFSKLGGLPALGSAADFKKYDDMEIEKWAAVTKSADLHVDYK